MHRSLRRATYLLLALHLPLVVQSAEVVPGLDLFPNSLTCCPTAPLIGPAWIVDTSALPISLTGGGNQQDSQQQQQQREQCSLIPSLENPMVLVFQSSGVVNAWLDRNACHYAHGSYYMGPTSSTTSSPYAFDFEFVGHFKSQPFSCATLNCNTRDVESFWYWLSTKVTTLVITGYTNLEMRDRNGQVVVRLEALKDSYTCDALGDREEDRDIAEELCNLSLGIPKPPLHQSPPWVSANEFSPESATGGGSGVQPNSNSNIGKDSTVDNPDDNDEGTNSTTASNAFSSSKTSLLTILMALAMTGSQLWPL